MTKEDKIKILHKILFKYKIIHKSFLREQHKIINKYINDSKDDLLRYKLKCKL